MTQDELPNRLRAAARDWDGQPLSLEHLLALHGSAGPGTLLVLMAAPCVLPVPGVGNLLGAALLLLLLALAVGAAGLAYAAAFGVAAWAWGVEPAWQAVTGWF